MGSDIGISLGWIKYALGCQSILAQTQLQHTLSLIQLYCTYAHNGIVWSLSVHTHISKSAMVILNTLEAYCILSKTFAWEKLGYLNHFFLPMLKSMVNACLPEFSDFTRVFSPRKSFMQWAAVANPALSSSLIFMPPHRRCRSHYVSGLSVRPSGFPSNSPFGFFRLRENSSLTSWNLIKLGTGVHHQEYMKSAIRFWARSAQPQGSETNELGRNMLFYPVYTITQVLLDATFIKLGTGVHH